MEFLLGLFSAISAIPKIADAFKWFMSVCATWYISNVSHDALQKISDAAALAMKAETDEERFIAAQAWRDALKHKRAIGQL